MIDLDIQKELTVGQERNRLHRSTRNGVWLSAIPHRLNGTKLYQGGFWDNLRLRYRLITQDVPTTFDGCGKKFSIKYNI